jgi:uncharacterized protein
LLIRRSSIEGKGVYAAEKIPPGQFVIEYTGERISIRETTRRFEKLWRAGKKKFCFMRASERVIIDGGVNGSGAELINHSCDPNLVKHRTRARVFYHSSKPIRPGEELTVDYCFSKTSLPVACHCGARTCRGTINLK